MKTPRAGSSARAEALRPEGHGTAALMVLTAVLVLGVIVATYVLVQTLWRDGIQDRRRELGNLALTLSEQTARAFQSLEIIQADMIAAVEAAGVENRAQLADAMGTQQVHRMMREKISGLPFVDALTLIDDTGRLVNFSRYWPIPKVNVADRDYFRQLRTMLGPSTFVSEPVPNRGSGTITIYLARRFASDDGAFLGLVLAAMEQSYFERFYGSIRLGGDGMIALVRNDGALLARQPGGSAGTGPQDAAVRGRTAAAFFGPGFAGEVPAGTLDEKMRLAAVQPIGDLPVFVVVSESTAALEAQLRARSMPIVLAAGLLCVTLSLGSYSVVRKFRSERAFADAQHAAARTDPLTGLANRRGFAEAVEQALAAPGGPAFGLLFLDLDYFKSVNDTLGHDVGDAMLSEVAERLRSRLPPQDLVARFGGDEFAVLHAGPCGSSEVQALARSVIATLQEPFLLGDHRVVGSCSVGVVLCPRDGRAVDGLLKNADLALYRAKADGRGIARLFQEEMEREARERRRLELELHAAWKDRQFHLDYQPIFEARSGRLAGFEALARWHHPERGAVPPDVFIPVAEETGLIFALGAWVLMEACCAAAQWPDHLFISVNLSPLQFRGGQALHQVRAALDASGLPPGRLEIEITESTLLQEGPTVHALLDQFRTQGITVALDDFGTGYSSLRYLRTLNIGRIKVDRSFVDQVADSPESLAIARAIIGLAATLSLSCTAEGIETEAQRRIMEAEGCTHLQGFLLGRPGTAEEALRLATAVPA